MATQETETQTETEAERISRERVQAEGAQPIELTNQEDELLLSSLISEQGDEVKVISPQEEQELLGMARTARGRTTDEGVVGPVYQGLGLQYMRNADGSLVSGISAGNESRLTFVSGGSQETRLDELDRLVSERFNTQKEKANRIALTRAALQLESEAATQDLRIELETRNALADIRRKQVEAQRQRHLMHYDKARADAALINANAKTNRDLQDAQQRIEFVKAWNDLDYFNRRAVDPYGSLMDYVDFSAKQSALQNKDISERLAGMDEQAGGNTEMIDGKLYTAPQVLLTLTSNNQQERAPIINHLLKTRTDKEVAQLLGRARDMRGSLQELDRRVRVADLDKRSATLRSEISANAQAIRDIQSGLPSSDNPSLLGRRDLVMLEEDNIKKLTQLRQIEAMATKFAGPTSQGIPAEIVSQSGEDWVKLNKSNPEVQALASSTVLDQSNTVTPENFFNYVGASEAARDEAFRLKQLIGGPSRTREEMVAGVTEREKDQALEADRLEQSKRVQRALFGFRPASQWVVAKAGEAMVDHPLFSGVLTEEEKQLVRSLDFGRRERETSQAISGFPLGAAVSATTGGQMTEKVRKGLIDKISTHIMATVARDRSQFSDFLSDVGSSPTEFAEQALDETREELMARLGRD